MTAALLPWPRAKFFFPNTNYPLAGGKLYTYAAGTVTPLATYSDSAGTIPNTNPVILDANGEAAIYLMTGLSYKINLTDASGVQIAGYPIDNMTGADFAANQLRADLANTANTALGDALLGVLQPFTGAIARNQHLKNTDIVTPQDFGAVANAVTDDQAAIVLAANYASANNKILYMTGNYGISKLTLTGINGLVIVWGCTFTAISVSAQTSLFEMVSCNNIYAVGNLSLNVAYKTNYTVGLWVYSPTASQFLNLGNISVGGAAIAYRFGSPSYVDALISEITISGGHTYGCPSICDLYGTQTVVSVHGVNWSADYGSGSGAWLALPVVGVSANGSYISFHGGEVLMTSITSGVLFESKPITSISYDNRFGSIICLGATLETASPLARAVNPNAVIVAAATGELHFSNCTGFHSQNLAAFIFTNTGYTGKVLVKASKFFCSVARTGANYNISCVSNATVECDQDSFYTNFMGWITGISGGLVRLQNGMMMYKNGTQAIGAAAWTKVTVSGTIATGLRGGDQANSKFVCPVAGVYQINFNAYGSSSSAAGTFTTAIYLNGAIVIAGESNYSSGANLPVASASEAKLVLATNDVIEFYANPSAANFTLCNSTGNCAFSVAQLN